MSEPEDRAELQRRALAAALARKAVTLSSVWLRYFSLGGEADELEVEGWLQGLVQLPAMQRDMLAQAVNERLDELAEALRVPSSREP
ncbi:hypothetical protein CLV35_3854 [Motilibacter peucedani]|uniref:Uncharacterized protein n=1 Tax=Motilibacter peucedani TaxID=598650 RepID=A0A420XKA7_9ACTN|nr:hypothetical protein [Motilibacter peucedani]RKS67948.1 hypothetical protein CLV35_3854 [Motilibacter peucedani]